MMVPAVPKTKPVTFLEFVEWKPAGNCYELYNGVVVEINWPVGKHEDIICFLNEWVTAAAYLRLNLPYGISKTAVVKLVAGESAYSPDVLVFNRSHLVKEPLWEKASTVTQSASVPLIIKVVSTNCRIDYLTKVKDFEEMGVHEYWIVNYLQQFDIKPATKINSRTKSRTSFDDFYLWHG